MVDAHQSPDSVLTQYLARFFRLKTGILQLSGYEIRKALQPKTPRSKIAVKNPSWTLRWTLLLDRRTCRLATSDRRQRKT